MLCAQIHGIQWDPYSTNEFTSAGSNSSLLFWILDESGVCEALIIRNVSNKCFSLSRCSICTTPRFQKRSSLPRTKPAILLPQATMKADRLCMDTKCRPWNKMLQAYGRRQHRRLICLGHAAECLHHDVAGLMPRCYELSAAFISGDRPRQARFAAWWLLRDCLSQARQKGRSSAGR